MNPLVKILSLMLLCMMLSVSVFAQQEDIAPVVLSGEVALPGQYAVYEGSGVTLSDLISDAGGLTANAFEPGIKVCRRMTDTQYERMVLACRLAQEQLSSLKVKLEVPERNMQYTVSSDAYILPGDEVVVPRQTLSVKISGAVQSPASIVYYSGWTLDDYIRMAGGYTRDAAKGKVYVISPNGEKQRKSKAQIQPECEICVPSRLEPDERTISKEDIITICTSTNSVTDMVIMIVDKIKGK